MDKERTDKLKQLYYEKLGGIGGLTRLWDEVRGTGQFKRKEVKEWLSKQRNVQETLEVRVRPKMFTSWRAKKPGSSLAIDLMFWNKEDGPPRGARKKKYSGVLNVIDIYSRKAWSEFITGDKREKVDGQWVLANKGRKGKKSVRDAFERILGKIKKKVKHVNMDEGNEFTNKLFTELLEEKGITPHYSRKEEFMKNPVVERFNRTVRTMMRKYRGKDQDTVSVDTWQSMMQQYNSKVHRTIKATPNEVWDDVFDQKQSYTNPTFSFDKGDQVRVLEGKGMLDKGQKYKWSKKVYRIYQVDQVKKLKRWKYRKDGTRKRRTVTAPSTSRVARYYLEDEDGPLSYKRNGKERPTWYMGYQLLKVNSVEDAPGYSAEKATKASAQLAADNKAEKEQRKLSKEGVNPSNILRPKRGKGKDMKWYDGKMIAVKWILELDEWDEDGALDVANIERFKPKRNKDGSFKKGEYETFEGRIDFNKQKKKLYILYKDQWKKPKKDQLLYRVNLTDPTKKSFLPAESYDLL